MTIDKYPINKTNIYKNKFMKWSLPLYTGISFFKTEQAIWYNLFHRIFIPFNNISDL